MISSAEEVFENLLTKWKNDRSLIVVILTGADWAANVTGVVSECSAEAVQFSGPMVGLTLSFKSAVRFEYGEPREAPEWLREDMDSPDMFASSASPSPIIGAVACIKPQQNFRSNTEGVLCKGLAQTIRDTTIQSQDRI